MTAPYVTLGSAPRAGEDRFDAAVETIGFVLRRHRPPDWSIRELVNPEFDVLALATGGRASYQCQGERFDVTRGTMLYFPRGVAHSGVSDAQSPWSFYSVGFRLRPSDDRAAQAFAGLPRHAVMGNATELVDYFRRLEGLWRRREPGFAMAGRGLVLLMLQQNASAAVAAGRRVPHASEIEAIVRLLHASIGKVHSVAELAERAGLSDSRFRLLFHQVTGCSVTRYQNRLRIGAAKDLLAGGQSSVGQIAEELGFRDVYYFSRLFKRITGLSPSRWRRR